MERNNKRNKKRLKCKEFRKTMELPEFFNKKTDISDKGGRNYEKIKRAF